jgi:hypothetical protein
MNPEIEKLIDLALKDGQITEKEREIILRKAETLGLDKDEIEMILEGIISDQNCGAPAKAFSDKCDSCGEDFRFNTLSNLTENLTSDSKSNAVKISRQNIPINKEELIEFATFSFGNANNAALGLPERNAWYSKFKEAQNKLKLSYQIDFNPFKSDNNIAFMGNLIDKAKQIQLENELSGQDIKDKEEADQMLKDMPNATYKNPGWWVALALFVMMCWGGYKLIIHFVK